jgi:hypothetical protein
VNAASSQFAPQLILAGDGRAGQHFADYVQALRFHGSSLFAAKQRRGPSSWTALE